MRLGSISFGCCWRASTTGYGFCEAVEEHAREQEHAALDAQLADDVGVSPGTTHFAVEDAQGKSAVFEFYTDKMQCP